MKHLSILEGSNVLFAGYLPDGCHVIGRDVDVAVYLDYPGISRHHATLFIEGDSARIADMHSSNGTFVNGIEVDHTPVPLDRESRVMIGTLRLVIRERAEALPKGGMYEVGPLIAHGGMGNVMSAVQSEMRREVAMKVIRGDATPRAVARFLDEARVTGSLEHPNIVPVHEIGTDAAGEVFYTMKLIRGETLAAVLAGIAAGSSVHLETYPLSRLLTVFQKACDAVAFAHSKGILHRDLKPENIMVGDFGEVQVMDWGLAKRIMASAADDGAETPPGEGGMGSTLDGSILGTPQYMSPEQARGELDRLDERSDVYALGAILHEILYLTPAHPAGEPLEIIERVSTGGRVRMPKKWKAAHLPGGLAPKSLRAVSQKALSFEPGRRYQNVRLLQEDVAAYQGGHATSAEKAGLFLRFSLFVRRHQAVSSAVALAVLMLAALSVAYSGKLMRQRDLVIQQRNLAERARHESERERRRAEDALMRVEEEKVRAESALAVAVHEQKRIKEARADLRRHGDASRAMKERLAEAVRGLPDADAVFAMMHGQAVRAGDIQDALANINRALERAPSNPDYLIARANLYQATGQFRRAIPDYERAMAIRPDPFVEQNLATTRQWVAQRDNREIDDEELRRRMEEFLAGQQRLESLLLDEILQPEALAVETSADAEPPTPYSPEEARLVARIGQLTSQPAWNRGRLKHLGGGRLQLDLQGLNAADLSGLKGNGVVELNLAGTDCGDLSPIVGMKLEKLVISGTRVADLRPLKGMPIRHLECSRTPVADFGMLAGCPLEILRCENTESGTLTGISRILPLRELYLGGASLNDIGSLKGLSLKTLRIAGSPVTELRPLAGMPLESLELIDCPMESLRGLENLPLRRLNLQGAAKVADFRILGTLQQLESLVLPAHAAGLGSLKKLAALKLVNHPRFGGPMEAARFIPLSDASDAAWAVIGPQLMATGATDLRPDRLTIREPRQAELDLRGTGIKDLKPLAGFPLHRLMIDTPDPDLDLGPLAGKEELRHLCLIGTKVAKLLPLMRGSKLESIAVSRHAADIHFFGRLATLKWIGFQWNEAERRAATPRDEFFTERARQADELEGKPGAAALAYGGFDDFLKGAENWSLLPTGSATAEMVWLPDSPPAVGGATARGGGCVAAVCTPPDQGTVWFNAPASFLGDKSAALGGGLEIHLYRQGLESTTGTADVELFSGSMRLVQVLELPKTSGWRIVQIPLDPTAGWLVGDADGIPATEVQIRDVLANLREFRIRANQSPEHGRLTGLDDVAFWPKKEFVRRKRFNDAWRERVHEDSMWAAEADILSADNPGFYQTESYPKVRFEYGARWIERFENRHGVLIVHPLEQSSPAVIRLPSPPPAAKDLHLVFEAKASVPRDGNRIVVASGGKPVANLMVNDRWTPVRLPVELFTPEEPVEIQVHAIGWAWEACRIHRVGWSVTTTLVPTGEQAGAKWGHRFTHPGAGWEQPDFNDSEWPVANGAFGRLNAPDARVRTPWESAEIWMRHKFRADPAAGGRLALRIFHDDHAKVYLNGEAVADLQGFGKGYEIIPLHDVLLKDGENVIAIHCRQDTHEQYIDAGLLIERPVAGKDRGEAAPAE